MKTRRLGRTGLKVSELCLGTMTFAAQADEAEAFRIMDAASAAGIDFIDTADCYPVPIDLATVGRTEEIIGKWLRGKRDRFVLATKCRIRTGPGANDEGLSRRHVMRSCEQSLQRLGTDHFDLYQAHSPDPDTPLEETLRAFEDLVRQGKVRYVGCSNYPAWQLALATGLGGRDGLARFDCLQPRYNLLHRDIEAEHLPLCVAQGIGVIAYNPLAGGLLTGKYATPETIPLGTRFSLGKAGELYRERYWHKAQFEAVDSLRKHFAAKEMSLATAAVAWVLAQPGITSAILGASRAEQLKDTLAATEVVLDERDLEVCGLAWLSLPRLAKPTR